MSKQAVYIIAVVVVVALIIYMVKKNATSTNDVNAQLSMAKTCYKQLASFVDNNPTMTGADIKNNFVSNLNCASL